MVTSMKLEKFINYNAFNNLTKIKSFTFYLCFSLVTFFLGFLIIVLSGLTSNLLNTELDYVYILQRQLYLIAVVILFIFFIIFLMIFIYKANKDNLFTKKIYSVLIALIYFVILIGAIVTGVLSKNITINYLNEIWSTSFPYLVFIFGLLFFIYNRFLNLVLFKKLRLRFFEISKIKSEADKNSLLESKILKNENILKIDSSSLYDYNNNFILLSLNLFAIGIIFTFGGYIYDSNFLVFLNSVKVFLVYGFIYSILIVIYYSVKYKTFNKLSVCLVLIIIPILIVLLEVFFSLFTQTYSFNENSELVLHINPAYFFFLFMPLSLIYSIYSGICINRNLKRLMIYKRNLSE